VDSLSLSEQRLPNYLFPAHLVCSSCKKVDERTTTNRASRAAGEFFCSGETCGESGAILSILTSESCYIEIHIQSRAYLLSQSTMQYMNSCVCVTLRKKIIGERWMKTCMHDLAMNEIIFRVCI